MNNTQSLRFYQLPENTGLHVDFGSSGCQFGDYAKFSAASSLCVWRPFPPNNVIILLPYTRASCVNKMNWMQTKGELLLA